MNPLPAAPSPTERLILRPLTEADAPFILALLNSPDWLKYIGDRGVHNVEDARNYLKEKYFPVYKTPGCGPMACVLKTDGTIIGNTGVYDRPGLDLPDFGFAFLPKYHGQGYAYEASVANMAYAQQMGHRELLAITLPNNRPSIRLLEKLGFKREKEMIRLPNDEDELLLLRWKNKEKQAL
ncbi:MAG: GNAT family N-acetyltransferase [Bacteroidota bacterium]